MSDSVENKIKAALNQDYLEKHGTVDSITLPDDSLSDSVAPVDMNATPTDKWWTKAALIELPPPPKWKCELFGMGGRYILFPLADGPIPNYFWRLMQRLILGNRWVKL